MELPVSPIGEFKAQQASFWNFSTAFGAEVDLNALRHFDDDCSKQSPKEFRDLVRQEKWTSSTSGCCPGAVQANLVVLPKAVAYDFLNFCLRNSRSCPVLFVSNEPGSPDLSPLADADVRTDLPRYCLWRQGKIVNANLTNVVNAWKERDDFVTFLLGCSFSFENGLAEEGLVPRNVSEKRNVAMYRTNIPTVKYGIFGGSQSPLVVSMRPYKKHEMQRVVDITRKFHTGHGAPIHWGDPKVIGISDLSKPDWGDAPSLESDDIPMFWCCGVTPQVALAEAELNVDVAITHAPGHMLVTDIADTSHRVP